MEREYVEEYKWIKKQPLDIENGAGQHEKRDSRIKDFWQAPG